MNADLTILTADKGNASVIHNTSSCNRKFGDFLEEPALRRLAKDTMETVEYRTALKKLALAAEVSFCLVINHQPPLLITSKSKNHKTRREACGGLMECDKWNANLLVQSKGISYFINQL
jgi:hypothetical protein